MTWLDIVIVALIALSALFGVYRGFVREVLSLVVWVLSFWIAISFTELVSVWLERLIPNHDVRLIAAFVALFFVVLVIGMLIGRMIWKLARASGISGDRTFGALFGLLRGVVIVAVLVLVLAITPLAQEPAWREAMLVGYFESFALYALDMLDNGFDVRLPGGG